VRAIPHVLIGVGCGLVLAGPALARHPEIIGLAIVGSLLPDLDHEGSMASKVPVIGPIASMAIRLGSEALSTVRPIPNPYPSVISGSHLVHRGPWHIPAVAIAIYVALRLVSVPDFMAQAVMWGFFSHIVGDAFTKLGIAWLWPVYSRMMTVPRWMSWRSGLAMVELPIAVLVLVLCVRIADPGLLPVLS
jgi:membrane-bound metal-dependent hydrolase YbcI (DUF457 family)